MHKLMKELDGESLQSLLCTDRLRLKIFDINLNKYIRDCKVLYLLSIQIRQLKLQSINFHQIEINEHFSAGLIKTRSRMCTHT